MKLTLPIAVPAWQLLLLVINFQFALGLDIVILTEELGGPKTLSPLVGWFIVVLANALFFIFVVYVLTRQWVLLFIVGFVVDTGWIITQLREGAPYVELELFIYVMFWIVSTGAFFFVRRRNMRVPI